MVPSLQKYPMPTALVILPSTTYRASDFVTAAEGLGVDLIVASENPPPIAMGDGYLELDCTDSRAAAAVIASTGESRQIDGIVAADDGGVVAAALASRALGLPGNRPDAAEATRDKAEQRRRLAAAEIPQPRFETVIGDQPPTGLAYPIVIKPTDRSAGQGVILAESPEDAISRIAETRAIVGDDAGLIAEEFLVGEEVALEGIVGGGTLTTLAVFDKPGATPGPYFEETILVTPSRLASDILAEVDRVAARAVEALGISHGPVHIEMMVNDARVSVIEIAARSIGGLCSRTLNFGLTGTTLEALIIRNALGMDKPELHREGGASGVLMIPIPRSGRFAGVTNLSEVREIDHVTGIDLSVRPGTWVDPPPVGERYLGFVFARGEQPEEVTASLLAARETIEVVIE